MVFMCLILVVFYIGVTFILLDISGNTPRRGTFGNWHGRSQLFLSRGKCVDKGKGTGEGGKAEGLEVRLPIRPPMKSEATNEKNRYSLKRVPNYF